MPRVKAAVCRAFGEPLVIEEVTLAAPLAGEVEVTLAACAVCHSDISAADGAWGGYLPAVYGHEAAGTISAVGPGVSGFAVGDAVLVTLFKTCNACSSCHSNHPGACQNSKDVSERPITGADGTAYLQGIRCGAFAERVVVDQTQLVTIPADLPMDAASLLSCGVITGVGAAVITADIRPGQRVVVIGAGGVGLNAIQGARLAGAAHIVAVDMNEDKLDIAMEFGATAGILATDDAVAKKAKKVMGGSADAVLICTGAVAAIDSAPRYLAYHGKMVLVGIAHSGAVASYDPAAVGVTGQSIIGSKMGDGVPGRDIPWMIDLYHQGRLKLDELISGRYALADINDAIADTKSGTAKRNVIVFE